MALPKLEGEIRLSTATTVCTVNAGTPVVMPVGNYFLNSIGDGGATRSFCNEFAEQLTVSSSLIPWAVTVDDTSDSATGKVTLDPSIAMDLTWVSTDVRDLLGFTGNLSSAGIHVGTNQARYLWLPNCGRSGVMAPQASDGALETDGSFVMSTDGTTYSLAWSTRYKDSMNFRLVKGSKAWISKEVTANESFERFWKDCIGLGLRIRFHADRSVDATYRTWAVEDFMRCEPEVVLEDWADGANSLWSYRYRVRKSA